MGKTQATEQKSQERQKPPAAAVAEAGQLELAHQPGNGPALSLASDGSLPNHKTARAWQRKAILQMQRHRGNGYVLNRLPINRSGAVAQRQDEEEEGPSEAEKAAALAAAQAAEAQAAQSASEAQQETAKSHAEKSAEKEKGQSAKQKAVQESANAKALVEKAKMGPGKQKEAAAGGKKGELNGAGPGEKKEASAPKDKAPASPDEDPAFQKVIGKAKGVAAKKKVHKPADKEADAAQQAAEAPPAEIEARAQDKQVGEMEQAETPPFDAAAFKAQLMQRIEALAPRSAKEADEFKSGNKAGQVKENVKGQAANETEASQQPLSDETEAAPDTGAVEPKPVAPLEPADPGPPPENLGATAAAPKPKTSGEVETPLQEESQKLDQEMADADVTEKQLADSNEPEFQSALESKKEAKTHAVEAPQQYRQEEEQQLAQAQTEADATAEERTQAMHDDRAGLLSQVEGQQTQTKSADEQKRAEIAAHIQGIYENTKTRVGQILDSLDSEVERVFDAGAEAAKKAFEDYVDAKMKAYKQRRYGGWLGWARWAKDKIAGMPSEVNAFYNQGRRLYLGKMDAVIDNVVAVVGRGLTQAKAEIAEGKKKIQEYVAGLPEDLQEIGQQAAQDIQGKFDELEQSVDNKQNELIDSLAQKYNENLQAIDARIEELKAANQGLMGKAFGAIKGVIETIKKIKDMLLSVLAEAVDAIGKIIKDPIGFLKNLISGVKRGLKNFVANIGKHLKAGLMGWLFGEMAKSGIKLPERFDLKGILTLVMQVLGLTWENLRARAVKIFGEKIVAGLEKSFEIFMLVKEQGIGGLWNFVKDKLSDLKDTVIEGIKDMVITQVIKAGIQWLIGILGGPAGAFVKAAKAIYDIVMWFVNNGSQLMSLVQAIVSSISAIAGGAVGAAAKFIEESLAKVIPIVISFLASLLGLGDLGQKIKGIIQKVQAPINKAIEWVLDKAKAAVKKLGSALGLGKEEPKDSQTAEMMMPAAQVQKPLTLAGEGHTLTATSKDGKLEITMASPGPGRLQTMLVNAIKEVNQRPASEDKSRVLTILKDALKNSEEKTIHQDWLATGARDPRGGRGTLEFTQFLEVRLRQIANSLAPLSGLGITSLDKFYAGHPSAFVELDEIKPEYRGKSFRRTFYGGFNSTAEGHRTSELARLKAEAKDPKWQSDPLYGNANAFVCRDRNNNWEPHLADASISANTPLDHIKEVAEHWNTGGHKQTQAERESWYNDTNNLQVICRPHNSQKGGPNIIYKVDKDFRGPGE